MEYILINFMLYVRGNFKIVTIDLAIHSHSAPIIRLRCITIARKKSYIYVKNLNMTICRFFLYLSLKYISYFHNILWFFVSTVAATSFLPLHLLLLSARNDLFCNPCPPSPPGGGGG
jgi:hypothetical protein